MARRAVTTSGARTEPGEGAPRRWAPSLRVRTLLIIVLISTAPFVFATLASIQDPGQVGEAESDIAKETRRVVTLLTGSGDAVAQAQLRQLARHGGRFHLVSPGGEVTFSVGASHHPNLVERAMLLIFGDDQLPPEPPPTDLRANPASRDAFDLARERGRYARCAPSAEGRHLRCIAIAAREDATQGYVVMERARRRGVGALAEERYQLLRFALFLLPGALLLGVWLTWRMVVPIERLRRHVERRAQMASPSADLPSHRRDEFGDLARAFNSLASRLSERSLENEAFVADLAHEFKNPVAAITSAAEKLSEGPTDPARVARLAGILSDSAVRLQRVLDAFLELAHAEAGYRTAEREDVDLHQLVVALGDAQARTRDAAPALILHAVGSAVVHGVPDRLEAAFANLIDNALSFASQTVSVRLFEDEDWVEVTVSDDGPGIAEEDRARVFDRFFTRRAGRGGTGLGLALVRAVVEAHEGTVEVRETEPGPGAAFVVRLPRA